jgi:hypothetical protein
MVSMKPNQSADQQISRSADQQISLLHHDGDDVVTHTEQREESKTYFG